MIGLIEFIEWLTDLWRALSLVSNFIILLKLGKRGVLLRIDLSFISVDKDEKSIKTIS